MHLTPELCRLLLRGEVSPEAFVRAAVSHLLDDCSECRQLWSELASADEIFKPSPAAKSQGKLSQSSFIEAEIARQESDLALLRKQRRQARRDLKTLLDLAPDERRAKIENARTRYRSKPFVELLLEESRRWLRRDARTAADLATLVPVAIHWMAGSVDGDWAGRMQLLALAAEGNALRICGDLSEASRRFRNLRRRLGRATILGTADLAEVATLEATLRFEQNRYDEAEHLLDKAILHHRLADNVQGLAQSLLLRGQIHSSQSAFDDARAYYSQVTSLIEPEKEPYLFQGAVIGEGNALCGLGAYDEAEVLLEEHMDLFEDRDAYPSMVVRGLKGQIALGRGSWGEAELAFIDCRDGFLEIGRDHDATLACLDIAAAMLQQGKTAEVTRMASEVLDVFRARGADQEALSALILIQEAAASRTLTAAILSKVRRRLESHSG